MAGLFDPLRIRDVNFANRVFVSPMCQYSSQDGNATDWHLVHLGSRAIGGAGLIFTEATAVLPEGRISPHDLGIWDDGHIEMLSRIVSFIHEQGSIAGMQLAHAGRKASTRRPWETPGTVPENEGGWKKVVAPSALRFADNYPMPQALTLGGIQEVVSAFAAAARRACQAGFRVVEIHARCGRDDYFSRSGRAHHSDGTGRRGDYGARVVARSVLAIASGSRTGSTNCMAGAISEGGAKRRAAQGSGRSEEFRIVLRRTTRCAGTAGPGRKLATASPSGGGQRAEVREIFKQTSNVQLKRSENRDHAAA